MWGMFGGEVTNSSTRWVSPGQKFSVLRRLLFSRYLHGAASSHGTT